LTFSHSLKNAVTSLKSFIRIAFIGRGYELTAIVQSLTLPTFSARRFHHSLASDLFFHAHPAIMISTHEKRAPYALAARRGFFFQLQGDWLGRVNTVLTPEVKQMKAFLITPEEKSIEEVEIGNLDDVKALIGFETLESDAVGSEGDRLYFDEECFLRGTAGRFQIDTLVPVSGRGVVVGAEDEGDRLRDVAIALNELIERTKYL
jgi:hypothetical protein